MIGYAPARELELGKADISDRRYTIAIVEQTSTIVVRYTPRLGEEAPLVAAVALDRDLWPRDDVLWEPHWLSWLDAERRDAILLSVRTLVGLWRAGQLS
jgi:hypothetical protein